MKKILCINYSQSGQLDEILENFIEPLKAFSIDRVKVQPKAKFPFPWSAGNFYDPMPEVVLEEPIELKELSFKEEQYDLIILGYQPWFLSPSQPTTSLLKDKRFKAIMKNTDIVTVVGARNMWLNAQEVVVRLIGEAGGNLVGNIALVDRAFNQLSAISIVHWMMTGKKTRKWGVFPLPGVSDKDIKECSNFGEVLNDCINAGDLSSFQNKVLEIGAVEIKTSILFIEGKAKKIFNIWANIIKKKEAAGKNRSFWISFFRYYLNFALFVVAPILLVFYTILIRPFKTKSIFKKKERFMYLGIQK